MAARRGDRRWACRGIRGRPPPVIDLDEVSPWFGGFRLLMGISLRPDAGERVADTVLVMDEGRIVEVVWPGVFLGAPRTERERAFLSQIRSR